MKKEELGSFGKKSKDVIDLSLEYEVMPLSTFFYKRPIVWDSAEGCIVRDIDGKEYLDFHAGFGAAFTGHRHPKVIEALLKQAEKLTHAPDAPNLPRALLAKKLAEVTPKGLKKSVLSLGGSDAMEIALKLTRKYTSKTENIAFHGGYHGKGTFGALSLTSPKSAKKGLFPLVPGTHFIPYAYCYRCAYGKEYPDCDLWCAKHIEYLLSADLTGLSEPAAIFVEPVQGVGGYIVPPDGFLPELQRITMEHELLLVVDEIHTNMGRFGGAMTACEELGVIPDIIGLGKGMNSGFPISAIVTKDKIADSMEPGMHSTTYTGNPLLCAVALANIEVIQELELPKRAKELGRVFNEILQDKILGLRSVGEVQVKGLLIGIEFVKDKKTKKPVDEEFMKTLYDVSLEKGLLFIPGSGMYGNRINIAPPLIINREEIEKGTTILQESIIHTEKES